MIHWHLHTPCAWGKPLCGRHEELLTADERARLAALRVPQRRAAWLLGRLGAKAVVADLLAEAYPGRWPLQMIEIGRGPCGAPFARIAPEAGPAVLMAPGTRLPISLSISHTEDHALCAATWDDAPWPAGARWHVGIDLGVVEPRSPEFVGIFFTEGEQRFVLDAPLYEQEVRANLVWCAKEAVLKALHLGLTVDTRDVTCLPVDGREAAMAWRLAPADVNWTPFVARCNARALSPDGGDVHGLWRIFPGFVGALALHCRVEEAAAEAIGSPAPQLAAVARPDFEPEPEPEPVAAPDAEPHPMPLVAAALGDDEARSLV